MKEKDLDKITWGDYKKDQTKSPSNTLGGKDGFSREKLLQIVQVAEMSGMKMYIWANCVQNFVRVYRNSMIDCIHKSNSPNNITVRKEYKEVYFK